MQLYGAQPATSSTFFGTKHRLGDCAKPPIHWLPPATNVAKSGAGAQLEGWGCFPHKCRFIMGY